MNELTSTPERTAAETAAAPDPRRDYASPEDLREDVALTMAQREALLMQWKQDVDRELDAESEGMGASNPLAAEAEARLAGEARRVSKALASIVHDRALTEAHED